MTDFVFISGNQHKADYLAKWLELPVAHQKVDQNEIQSLDLREVVEHKARQAYEILRRPVLVEDVSLAFTAMGRLPGTFIKWFVEEVDFEHICRMVDGLEHRGAECAIMYALYDGKDMHLFEARQQGAVPDSPRGTGGFGWNPIFQPDGSDLTYAEMDEETFRHWNIRAHAIVKLKAHLTK